MAVTAEVMLITGRNRFNIGINGEVRSISDVLKEAGLSGDHTVRVNGELVNDHNRELSGGETLTAFATQTVARAGVKGAFRS